MALQKQRIFCSNAVGEGVYLYQRISNEVRSVAQSGGVTELADTRFEGEQLRIRIGSRS